MNTGQEPASAEVAAPVLSEHLRLYDAEIPYASASEPRPLLIAAYQAVVQAPSPRNAVGRGFVPRSVSRSYADMVASIARKHDIDPDLLQAIMFVESRANPRAVSHAGARGLMQVMPATARRFGVRQPLTELHDPYTNLNVAAVYLKKLQTLFGNDLRLVLAGYNAGEGAVLKYGRKVPPYRETQGYVVKVLDRYQSLRGGMNLGR
jgi:soluble lytic murein transglycosylase-like protein